MPYVDISNPRRVRASLESAYANYQTGRDLFPSVRLHTAVENLPRKTQPVAANLGYAWAVIDNDRSFFERSVLGFIESTQAARRTERALVMTNVGRNAVYYADVSVTSEAPKVELTVFPTEEFVTMFDGHEFNIRGGGSLTLRDGVIEGPVDGLVVRHGNVSGIFGAPEEEAAELMRAMGTTEPISVPREVAAILAAYSEE
jgi:hypothetical protein